MVRGFMARKIASLFFALTVVMGSFLAHAEIVGEDVARAVAEGFLSKSSVANTILAGRSVDSVEAYGSLWIVRLAPSGYIEVAGSTKCAPILSFSEVDFAEPEADSPLAAKLSADSLMVEKKEANESVADNADWAKYTAPVAKKRMLLSAKPTGTDGTGYTPFVAPLLGATWHQTAPYNDLSPYNYFCGCMATAAGQELRYWRWPYRYEKFRTSAHGVRDAQNNYHTLNLKLNGLVPFDWDKIKAHYRDETNPSTPWANDKKATYNAAYLTLWAQSLTGMGYKPGGSGGTKQLASTAEEYWYESGKVMTYWNDGYTNLWNAIKADLDWGSPIQINTAAHQMVIDGYAVENYGTADEVDYINLNLGYGGATYWDDLKTAVTEGTYSGTLAAFQTGFRPQKIVQFEPVPKVSGTELELAWHLPPCYTNRISGFLVQTATNGVLVVGGGGMVLASGDTTTRYTYAASNLEKDRDYTFTVTPIMSDASEARPNSVTTTIGEPKAAPEFLNVSSVACGIELLQQDIFIECAYGQVNDIKVTCSESTTSLTNYSSHTTIIPDNKISVTKNGNVFTVSVDATDLLDRWNVDGEMILLTMVAKNEDGTEAYKNLMLRFNSMRQVINGTFDAAEGDGNSPVWFCGNTTIDAKGRAVSFGASAFQGTGKVTLTDSIGGGSFTFASLDNFKGTLVFTGNCSVTLPDDMTKFEGTLNITSGTYTLSNDLSDSTKVIIADGVTVTLDNANVASTITGAGTVSIASGSSVLSGAVTSSVSLSGGELTIPAVGGDYSTVTVSGGTLKIQLTKARSILGYDWWLPLYTSGAVKFVLYDGTEVAATTTTATPGIRISLPSEANVWTGEEWAIFGDKYSQKWSNGLPGEGDYVIFNSALDDTDGTMMRLDLGADRNLGYVLVKGVSKLEIGKYNTDVSAHLTADVLENEVETHITTEYFKPKAVIPRAKLSTSSGFILDCELDSAYADNLKRHETGGTALTGSDYWQGTVVFCNKNLNLLEISNYGNAQSRIRFNGVTGSLLGGKVFDGTLELVDYGESPALNINAGSTEYSVTIGSVVGNGTFKISGETSKMNLLLKDISGWTGSFDLASKTVAIGQTVPSAYTDADGRLHICQAVTVADGATWKAAGGLYLGAGGALTVNGAVETKNVTTYGSGASITLGDDAVLQVEAASVNDNVPTLNFKAGTFRVKEGSDAFRETSTINFCAASGKRTVIDANGATLTLGPNVFSGAGDVCLTSSKEGGKIIVEGVPAAYTGTIYCDISCEVSLGDLSKATNCTIDVSDIIVSRSSSDIGNFTIGAGASLEVTVSKAHLMSGLEIDSVTLVDGGTLVLRDKDGKELEYTTSDGKYILDADSSVTAECLLDYEFNGNAASTGSDNNATLSASSTITYYDSSALYTKCTPWINKEFAMPDDEWTAVIRGTLPAANSENPTIVIMFGANGGNIFGLVAGTEENTVALADRSSIIGSAVAVEDATTKYHVYTIVKTASRVRLYVDGVLEVDEARVVSIPKKFQIGSVHGSNNSSYVSCTGDESRLDYLKFYDFAVGEDFEEMVYSGPKPVAVWVAGEFYDDKSAHGGLEFALNDNTIDENGYIVIGNATTLGATVAIPSGTLPRMTMLVKYSVPAGGAPVAQSVPASLFSTYDMGALAGAGSSALAGYWLNGSTVSTGSYAFSNPAQTMPQEGYILVSNWSKTPNASGHGTAVYSGETLSELVGGEVTGLRFTGDNNYITAIGVGGPTVAGAKPWSGMVIKSVALFDEWVATNVIANYKFPVQCSLRTTDTDYPVPYSWFLDYDSVEAFVSPESTAANDQNSWWQCYVLGLDPTNETSKFTVSIRMEGTKPIVEYSPTNEVLKASGDISYILLGKPALSNDWQEVQFNEPGDTNRIFRVKVAWTNGDEPKAIYSDEVKLRDLTFSPKTNWFTEDASAGAGDLPQTSGARFEEGSPDVDERSLNVDCDHEFPLFYILPTFSGSATKYRIETIIKDLAVNASTNCLPIFEGEEDVPYASIAAAYNEGTNYWYAWNGATWSRLDGSVHPSGPYTNAIEFTVNESRLNIKYSVNGVSLGTVEHSTATELPSLTKLGFSGYGKFERFSGEGIEASLTLMTTMSLDELIDAGLVTNGFEFVESALAHKDGSGLYGWQKMVLGISTESGEKPFVAPVQNSSSGSLSFKVGNYKANSNFINKTAKFQVYEVTNTGAAVENGLTSGEELIGDTASINLDSVNSVKFFRIKIRFE